MRPFISRRSLLFVHLVVLGPAVAMGRPGHTAMDGPPAGCDEIVFAQRVSGNDHWYGNFGHYCETESPYANRALTQEGDMRYAFGRGGRLCRLNLRTGQLAVLLDDPLGGVRDPHVHYEGREILFSYRPADTKTFHLYEIDVDGTHLRQLTDDPDNDIEPIYTPDGGIVFCSSRCHRFVPCWRTQVATLYRCDADGGNVHMLSSNAEQENTPWMMPDGRVLYMRWEYVDRHMMRYHHLWTINPDGTAVMVFFGNQHPGGVMIDAKPIPDTGKVVASFSPGHGRTEHEGIITIVDPSRGPDDMSMARKISSRRFRDPYPLSEDLFLVADREGLHLLNSEGDTETIYRPDEPGGRWDCHEPRPLRPRPREPVIPSRGSAERATGRLILSDIYAGRNMDGVRRGEIKKLLVLEQLPRPANFSNGQEPLTVGGTFMIERILGTVPVEEDGSAYMELPALRSLFFVALDPYDIILIRHLAYFQLGEAPLHQRLCNLDRPEKSLLLRAPLGKQAGGLQRCGKPIFADASDPDYLEILATVQDAAVELAKHKRFDMPGFRPNRFYIREMQRFGILPQDLSDNKPVDSYAVDRAYWDTFRYQVTVQGGTTGEK